MRAAVCALASLTLLVSGCSAAGEEYDVDRSDAFLLANANERRGGETYQDYDARRDSYDGSRGHFHGFGCTSECAGHKSGYKWAQDNKVSDPAKCVATSWSFEEGCQSYIIEKVG